GARSQLELAVAGTGDEAVFDSDLSHGLVAIDHSLEVQAKSTRSFQVELDGAVPLRREGGDLVYDLTLWRQAKAIPDHWDLTVTSPDGWTVAEVVLTGGGDGQGMGIGGKGRPISAERTDGAVRLEGAATQDVELSIRFTRPLWDRFTDWLREPAL
ncbi:MAG: hypothetical protein R3320_04535, partial [Nitriliruptorales bacterium]|nr:hypothetical protein [Nitriliruptorales bacterium]